VAGPPSHGTTGTIVNPALVARKVTVVVAGHVSQTELYTNLAMGTRTWKEDEHPVIFTFVKYCLVCVFADYLKEWHSFFTHCKLHKHWKGNFNIEYFCKVTFCTN